MAREFYLDDEYSPLGDGYYQPLYRFKTENGDEHECEADSRHRWEVKAQLGLEYDEDEMKFYDPDEAHVPKYDEDAPLYSPDNPRLDHSLSLWATAL